MQPSGGGNNGQASAVRAPASLNHFDSPDAMAGDHEDDLLGQTEPSASAEPEPEHVAVEQPHVPHLPLVAGDVHERDLRVALVKLLANRDLEGQTIGSIRADLEVACGMAPGAFDGRREETSIHTPT